MPPLKAVPHWGNRLPEGGAAAALGRAHGSNCTWLSRRWKHQPVPALPEEACRLGGSLERLACSVRLLRSDPDCHHIGLKTGVSGESLALVLAENSLV